MLALEEVRRYVLHECLLCERVALERGRGRDRGGALRIAQQRELAEVRTLLVPAHHRAIDACHGCALADEVPGMSGMIESEEV